MNLEEKAKNKIELFSLTLKKLGFNTTPIQKKEYHFEFSAGSVKNKVKINIYFGKKGIKTIIQGDEKSDFYKEVKSIIFDEPELELQEPKLKEPEEYIGTDECGKGDFFGPLVVGAVYVDNETRKKLINLGVKDSKELSDNQIGMLSIKIRKVLSNNYELIKITPQKYNLLYNRFKNLNKLLNWAHSKAVSTLFERVDCKFVITDKFSNKDLDISFQSKHSEVEFIQETKAEKYTGVAAASILARDSFNNWFESIKHKGLDLPKGSSTTTEVFAEKLLKKIGEEKLTELAKLHFKTLKKINNN